MTVHTKAYYEHRVAKGAAVLDATSPNWFKKIVFKRLVISDICDCVAGQAGLNRDYGFDFNPALGFDRARDEPSGSKAFDLLRDAWIEEVRARRAKARA